MGLRDTDGARALRSFVAVHELRQSACPDISIGDAAGAEQGGVVN